MSHTDKTDPYWVRMMLDAQHTEEWHRCGPDHGRDCDLDAGPSALCRRFSTRDHLADMYGDGPTRAFINDVWTHPDRRATAAECRDALRDYNAHGETDVIVRTDQHRHRGLWWWF